MACLSGLCVLIVEDEPIIALDLVFIVEGAGAEVLGPAATLAEAEALSCNGRIAVALLDVRLGRDTIAPIAAKLANRGVPLIFHTGHGDAENLIACWPGARVLPKPARSEELLAALRDAAER
jgi:DNA-binding response OmpR family regulator